MHIPVLAEEVVKYLNPKAGGVYVDATLGLGGHTEALLRKSQIPMTNDQTRIKIVGIERDEKALEMVKERLVGFKGITFVKDNFVNLKRIVDQKVDGVLFDLGLSSYQLDTNERGFSFQKEGPLDMRMDSSQLLTAADIVNNWDEAELVKIFFELGQERFAHRIARSIVRARKKEIKTTFQLKEIVEKATPSWKKRETLARIFQALRIAVNNELENLSFALRDAIDLLKKGGRIVVISYHSLEDRMVKRAFKSIKVLTKKPIVPNAEEISVNPRARSAKLRAAEKI